MTNGTNGGLHLADRGVALDSAERIAALTLQAAGGNSVPRKDLSLARTARNRSDQKSQSSSWVATALPMT